MKTHLLAIAAHSYSYLLLLKIPNFDRITWTECQILMYFELILRKTKLFHPKMFKQFINTMHK